MEKKNKKPHYFLKPGHLYIDSSTTSLLTVVGTSIAVTLYDSQKKYGGMAHFLLPKRPKSEQSSSIYGNIAVPYLIQCMLGFDSSVQSLEAHIIGGGKDRTIDQKDISKHNISIARKIIKNKNIKIAGEDIGGTKGRKIVFNNKSGELIIYKLNKGKTRKSDWYPYE